MLETPNKGPIRFLEKHIIKHDRKNNLEVVAMLFPNIDKWITNEDIDNELSNDFRTNKSITNSQKHVSQNYSMDNIWRMLKINCSLEEKPFLQLHVLYVTHQNQTLGYMCF